MPQTSIAAYGVYSQQVQLQSVVAALNRGGFENQHICLLLAPAHPIATRVHDMRSLACESASSAALAGLVGWLSRLGAVVISNVGLFIRSRSFLQALLGANEAPASCRKSGTLASLGIPERDAGRLGNRLEEDSGLIYVSCGQLSESERAVEILRASGAHETSCLA